MGGSSQLTQLDVKDENDHGDVDDNEDGGNVMMEMRTAHQNDSRRPDR